MGTIRTRPRSLRFVVTVALVLLAAALALPGGILAVNLCPRGDFETYQSYLQNGQPQWWQGFLETSARDWVVRETSGADNLHFMDSYSLGQFVASKYGAPGDNYHLEGNTAQGFASQYGYSFVFSQTVPVESGVDYALGGKIATVWKMPLPEADHTQIFKRIGIDPTGRGDPDAVSGVERMGRPG